MVKRSKKKTGPKKRSQPKPEKEAGDASWAQHAFERLSKRYNEAPKEVHDWIAESQSPRRQKALGPIDSRPRLADLSNESLQRHRFLTGSLLTGFEPQRHTMFVEGRPTQVLVLTHEKASPPEMLPYLGAKWFPMPILNIYGRCGKAEPQVHGYSAGWYGWRDRVSKFFVAALSFTTFLFYTNVFLARPFPS